MEAHSMEQHPQDYLTQHKPASRYWRITFYNQEREYVQADILDVDQTNSLVFKRTTIFDVALNRATEYIVNHSVSRDQWESVTECTEKGVPLWQFEYAGPVYGEDSDDETDLELEAVRLLIESVNEKIEARNKQLVAEENKRMLRPTRKE